MNQIIIGQERSFIYLTQNALFDTLSLADELYRSKLTDPKSVESDKLYFSENQAPVFLT